jgi:hypothetical protein
MRHLCFYIALFFSTLGLAESYYDTASSLPPWWNQPFSGQSNDPYGLNGTQPSYNPNANLFDQNQNAYGNPDPGPLPFINTLPSSQIANCIQAFNDPGLCFSVFGGLGNGAGMGGMGMGFGGDFQPPPLQPGLDYPFMGPPPQAQQQQGGNGNFLEMFLLMKLLDDRNDPPPPAPIPEPSYMGGLNQNLPICDKHCDNKPCIKQ